MLKNRAIWTRKMNRQEISALPILGSTQIHWQDVFRLAQQFCNLVHAELSVYLSCVSNLEFRANLSIQADDFQPGLLGRSIFFPFVTLP